jgi:hypothetical protein
MNHSLVGLVLEQESTFLRLFELLSSLISEVD